MHFVGGRYRGLIESMTQLTQPTGRVVLRATLAGGATTEGDLLWIDGSFLKLQTVEGATVVLAKNHVTKLEAFPATAPASLEDISPDRWAHANPDVA